MNMKKSKKAIVKARNWACLVYPDSAPENWIDILKKTGVPIAISPLHDMDESESEDTENKPHYHVIMAYGSGTVTENTVKNITESLNAPKPTRLGSVRGYFEYFTHKNDPEKYQYDESEIKTLNGFRIINYLDLSRAETDEIKLSIQSLIRRKNIIEYRQLCDYLQDREMYVEYGVVIRSTIHFTAYLRSARHEKLPKCNPDTGEIVEQTK